MAELAPSPLPTRDFQELDLLGEIKQTIGVLRRGWRLIGISALICLTVAIIYLARTKRIYQAEVRLLVLQRGAPRQTLENHKKPIVSRRRFETLRLIGEQVAESLSGNFLP